MQLKLGMVYCETYSSALRQLAQGRCQQIRQRPVYRKHKERMELATQISKPASMTIALSN